MAHSRLLFEMKCFGVNLIVVLNKLKNCGIEAIFIARVDGLSGFPSRFGRCKPRHEYRGVVHMIRNFTKFV
jgi:transposase-like protein